MYTFLLAGHHLLQIATCVHWIICTKDFQRTKCLLLAAAGLGFAQSSLILRSCGLQPGSSVQGIRLQKTWHDVSCFLTSTPVSLGEPALPHSQSLRFRWELTPHPFPGRSRGPSEKHWVYFGPLETVAGRKGFSVLLGLELRTMEAGRGGGRVLLWTHSLLGEWNPWIQPSLKPDSFWIFFGHI